MEVVRATAEATRLVTGIQEVARLERQAAAADARRQPAADRPQRLDPRVELGDPAPREPLPVPLRRRLAGGERVERLLDPVERDAGLLAGLDERDAAQGRRDVAALVAVRPLGVDQPLALVEAERGLGNAAAGCELADRHLT